MPQAAPAACNVSARDSDEEGEDDEDYGDECRGLRGGEDDTASVGDGDTGGGFYEDGGDADEEREEDGEDSCAQEGVDEDGDLHGEVRKVSRGSLACLQNSFLYCVKLLRRIVVNKTKRE